MGYWLRARHNVGAGSVLMSDFRKLTQQELSVALDMLESEIALYVTDNQCMADGSGYWVFFSFDAKTPKGLLSRLGVRADRLLALKMPCLEEG